MSYGLGQATCGRGCHTYCGYSNCFRQAVDHRGFMPVCGVHKAEPRKWGKDGHTFTGSTFVKQGDDGSALYEAQRAKFHKTGEP